jgi:hypothetical protein
MEALGAVIFLESHTKLENKKDAFGNVINS